MLQRRVPLLAILGALLSLLVVPTAAAAPADGILLRGSRTAYVDLYVYVNRTISLADVEMKTKGSYVGFYLAPAPANRDTVGALVMPRVGATGGSSATTVRLGESWDVRAGKYRMFLLTDGPAEVFVPIEGQGFRGWVPRGRAPLSVRRTDFDVAAGDTGETENVPLTLPARSLVVAVGQASSSSLTAVDHLTACVSAGGGCAATYAVTVRAPLARVWTYGVMLAPRGTVHGQLTLNRVVAGSDAGSHVDGAVLVLTIGTQS